MTKSFYTRFRLATRGNKLFWITLLFLVAAVFSYFVFITPDEGGMATFMSMAMIALVGYFYGPCYGFATSILFGCVMFLLHNQVPTVDVKPEYMFKFLGEDCYWGEVADYIIGYGLMGITGFFTFAKEPDKEKTRRLFFKNSNFLIGFIIASGLRFIEGIWNCYHFYGHDNFIDDITGVYHLPEHLGYCTWYSFWYIGIEAVLSLIILLLPPVAEAVRYIAECATSKYEENTNYL